MSFERVILWITCFVFLSTLPTAAEPLPFKDLEHSAKRWLELIDKSNSLSDNHQLNLDEKRRIFCRYGLQALNWGKVYRNELLEAAETARVLNKLSPDTGFLAHYSDLKNAAEEPTILLADYAKVYQNCGSYGHNEDSY